VAEEGPFAHLTSREREVLVQIAEGQSNKEIARRLDVGVRTIETHRNGSCVGWAFTQWQDSPSTPLPTDWFRWRTARKGEQSCSVIRPARQAGVRVWHEDKATTFQESRQDGGARRSPPKAPPDESPACKEERRERQGCPAQDQAQAKGTAPAAVKKTLTREAPEDGRFAGQDAARERSPSD